MKCKHVALLSVAAIASPARAASDVALAFGSRPYIQHISLSPDGTHVAMVQPLQGRGAAVVIGDLINGGEPNVILSSSGDPDRLQYCNWTTNTRLVCGIYMVSQVQGIWMPFTRLVAINSDGTGLKQLTARENDRTLGVTQNGGEIIDLGVAGSVLMTRQFTTETKTGTAIGNSREGLGVELVDTVSLKRNTVEQARESATGYISDGRGVIRVMAMQATRASGYFGNVTHFSYRKPGSNAWFPLSESRTLDNGKSTGLSAVAVDADLNVAYGFENRDGRSALYRVSLDGSGKKELVLANPVVDVDALITVGRQDRVVGASFATDRRQTEFFDPELRKLRAALEKALPEQPIVNFIDASADERKLLLFAGSDVDPGEYYLYDKGSRKLAPIMPVRTQLAGRKLAKVVAVTVPASDGTEIPSYLTLPPGSEGKDIPAIVMPHGGPGARDEWGFDWLSQFFAARGFAVLQPNFRGSSGYGDAWFQENGFRSWRTAINDVNEAGRWLIRQGIAATGKLAIVGWSYGGYAALQSAVLDPALYKAIVAIAPVTDLESLREEHRNFMDFVIVDKFIGQGAHVREGSPAQNVEAINAPVLMFHGDRDRNVGIAESRLMTSKLKGANKRVELVEFKGLDHQLEDDQARVELLDKTDAFLRAALGM